MTDLIRRVLVPTDFSPHAAHALAYAADLAGRFGARIDLLHVIDYPPPAAGWSPEALLVDDPGILEGLQRQARLELEGLAPRAASTGAEVETFVRTGPPAREIVEHARQHGCDLIVMGTRGRGGLAHVLLGSVAEQVLRRAPCAVLTLKDTTPPTPNTVHNWIDIAV